MNVEIIAHDTVNGLAEIKFTHNGVVHQDKYELIHVIPGTSKTLKDTNKVFDKDMQLKVIDTLTALIQNNIENGSHSPNLVGVNEPPQPNNNTQNIVNR